MEWIRLMSPKRFGEKKEADFGHLRSRFDQDYDRIVFSHPFRKLQDKTQVFPIPEQDFVHTRLTHSLEVSSVGRSLGRAVGQSVIERNGLSKLGLNESHFGGVVAAASLAHDIGNPPFGHSGEQSISAFFSNANGKIFGEHVTQEEWQDLISFEGNAQGFRILNSKSYGGLKLTYATLAAFTKYPRLSSGSKQPGRRSQKKYGICFSDKDHYRVLAEEMGLRRLGEDQYSRHPLAFLVEAADDICYHIIDLEDGCRLGLVSLDDVIELTSSIIGDQFSPAKLRQIHSKDEQLGILRAMTINQLINESVTMFLDNEQGILQAEFDSALADVIPSAPTLEQIIDLSVAKIYRSRIVLEREAAGFEVLEKLMNAFCMSMYSEKFGNGTQNPKFRSIYRLLTPEYQWQLSEEKSVYGSLQIILDFVSGLTDKAAVGLYKTISGYTLPNSAMN